MSPGYTTARIEGCGPGARELWTAVLDEHDRRAPHNGPTTVAEVLQPYERSAYLAFEPDALGPTAWLGPPLVLLAGPSFDGPLATRIRGARDGRFDPGSLRRGAPCRLRRGAGSGDDRPYVLAVGDALDLELEPSVLSSPAEPTPDPYVSRAELVPGSRAVRRAERAVELLVEAGAEDGLGWIEPLEGLAAGVAQGGDLGALVDGWNAVLEGTETAPPTHILGRGPGATPSGDDVLSGTLLALDRTTAGAERRRVTVAGQRLVAVATERTTTVSAALLAQAVRGRAAGRVDAAIRALLGTETVDLELGPAIREAAAVGHTSGVDLLVGALLVPLALGTPTEGG